MAVQLSATDRCCLQIQLSLDNLMRDLAPNAITERMGFLAALVSEENTSGFDAIGVDMFPGKRRPLPGELPKIEVEYDLPQCNDANQGDYPGLCDDQDVDAEKKGWLEVTVEECSSLGGQFDKAAFEQICESPNERLAKEIRSKARDVIRKMDKVLIEKAYSIMGLYADATSSIGATAKSVPILAADGFINPGGMAVVKSEFRNMHTDRLPLLVGGDILATWEDTRRMSGLGANAIGAEPNTQSAGIDMWLDYHLDPVIRGLESDTASHALSWVPGSIRLVEWYKYTGAWEELGKEDYTETTIVIDGMTFDYHLFYDKCDHVWKYVIGKCYDLFYVPDQAFQPCWDFNHRLHWEFGCGAWDCNAYNIG